MVAQIENVDQVDYNLHEYDTQPAPANVQLHLRFWYPICEENHELGGRQHDELVEHVESVFFQIKARLYVTLIYQESQVHVYQNMNLSDLYMLKR